LENIGKLGEGIEELGEGIEELGDGIEELLADNVDENMEFAQVLFECTEEYPDLHSTPYLVKAIIKAVEVDLPSIGDFLDGRLRKFEGISTT